MNENASFPAPSRPTPPSFLLPLSALALSLAAFGAGAPAKLARTVARTSAIPAAFEAELENSFRAEPVMFPMPETRVALNGASPAGAMRGMIEILGRPVRFIR